MRFVRGFVVCLLCGVLAGCVGSVSCVSLLDRAWLKDVDRVEIVGGCWPDVVEGEVAGLSLSDPSLLVDCYHVPESLVLASSEAAGFRHALLPNYLSVSAWRTDGSDVDGLVRDCVDVLNQSHWLDALPDVYEIFTVGDVVIVVFGISSLVDPFVDGLLLADGDVVLAASGDLAR